MLRQGAEVARQEPTKSLIDIYRNEPGPPTLKWEPDFQSCRYIAVMLQKSVSFSDFHFSAIIDFVRIGVGIEAVPSADLYGRELTEEA